MSNINDIKSKKLADLGFTSPSLSQKLVDFYRDRLSMVGGSRHDLERSWLLSELSLSSSMKATPDLWRKVYEASGYDNPYDYWLSGFVPIGTSATNAADGGDGGLVFVVPEAEGEPDHET